MVVLNHFLYLFIYLLTSFFIRLHQPMTLAIEQLFGFGQVTHTFRDNSIQIIQNSKQLISHRPSCTYEYKTSKVSARFELVLSFLRKRTGKKNNACFFILFFFAVFLGMRGEVRHLFLFQSWISLGIGKSIYIKQVC